MLGFLSAQVISSSQAPEYFRDTPKTHWVMEGFAGARKSGFLPNLVGFGSGHRFPLTDAELAGLLPVIAKNLELAVKDQINLRDILVASPHGPAWKEAREEFVWNRTWIFSQRLKPFSKRRLASLRFICNDKGCRRTRSSPDLTSRWRWNEGFEFQRLMSH